MMDTSMLEFLAPPFVASLILTGIHAYLGVHVVERGVIFVDLALAQIAALDHVDAEIRVYPGENEAGDERCRQELEHRGFHAICPLRSS